VCVNSGLLFQDGVPECTALLAYAEIKGTRERAARTEAREKDREEKIRADVFIARVHCKVRRPSVQINTRVAHVTV